MRTIVVRTDKMKRVLEPVNLQLTSTLCNSIKHMAHLAVGHDIHHPAPVLARVSLAAVLVVGAPAAQVTNLHLGATRGIGVLLNLRKCGILCVYK